MHALPQSTLVFEDRVLLGIESSQVRGILSIFGQE